MTVTQEPKGAAQFRFPRPADADGLFDGASERARDLGEWLLATLRDGVPDTVRKADQYGTVDLQIMGTAMQHLLRLEDDQRGTLAAIAFYLQGKVARIFGALEGGRMPTEDDWWDAAIYSLFGLRLQQQGVIV